MFTVHGKVIFISGGNRGIGRGIAIGLAKQRAHVIIAARNEETLIETSEFINNQGYRCSYVRMDVSSEESVQNAVNTAEKMIGGAIDVLVNNAGMSVDNAKAEEISESDWLQVLNVDLNGYFRVGKAVVKGMIAKGAGKIINISSIFSFNPIPLASAYCVSKAAINHLTRAWAVEWARYNIQVNAVAPGYIVTDLSRERLEDEKFRKKIFSRIPMGRFGEVDDLIGAVTFFASKASDYITGVILSVDGGWCTT
jgi:NAD(P)-dependent dehydrogenase (short-subunit alcohol dehydrogenase family)